eukprot:GHVT01065322.1.p2 GENE.GHVT01065322.1~~GHVT01065322.1.p2  ORF type:complete len:260 (-),score=21.55 GHVT01065322.1:5264-6043(-)
MSRFSCCVSWRGECPRSILFLGICFFCLVGGPSTRMWSSDRLPYYIGSGWFSTSCCQIGECRGKDSSFRMIIGVEAVSSAPCATRVVSSPVRNGLGETPFAFTHAGRATLCVPGEATRPRSLSSKLRGASASSCHSAPEMSGRTPVIGGNWKCNGTKELVKNLVNMLNNQTQTPHLQQPVQVVVAPPALHIGYVKEHLRRGDIQVATQNVALNPGYGAFTGEMSADMIKVTDAAASNTCCGCTYSTRRLSIAMVKAEKQ